MRQFVDKQFGRSAIGNLYSNVRAFVQFSKENGWYDAPAEDFIILPQRVLSPFSLEAFWDYSVVTIEPELWIGVPSFSLGYLKLGDNTWIVCQEPLVAWLGTPESRSQKLWFNLFLDNRKKFKIFSPFQMWDFAQGVQVVPVAQRRPTYTNNTTLGPTDLIEALWEFSPPSLEKLVKLSQQRKTGLVELLRLISMSERVIQKTRSPTDGV